MGVRIQEKREREGRAYVYLWAYAMQGAAYYITSHTILCTFVVAQVMEHDTFNSIALKFDTTPSQLAHLNRKQLHVGMVTLIPGEVGLL